MPYSFEVVSEIDKDELYTILPVYGDPHAFLEEEGTEVAAPVLAEDSQRLQRVLRLLLSANKVSMDDLEEAASFINTVLE
jgi:hypothetical protein